MTLHSFAPALQMTSNYGQPNSPIQSTRGIEYEAFVRVTARLKAAEARGQAGRIDLAVALHENRRLWTTLAADVAGADNGLPAPLRAQLFYLAEFTDQHSRKVLDGEETVGVLIEINTAVMRGLRGEGANAA